MLVNIGVCQETNTIHSIYYLVDIYFFLLLLYLFEFSKIADTQERGEMKEGTREIEYEGICM